MIRYAMGVNIREHRRSEDIVTDDDVEDIAVTTRRRRLELFGNVTRTEREHVGGTMEINVDETHANEKPKLGCQGNMRTHLKAWEK